MIDQIKKWVQMVLAAMSATWLAFVIAGMMPANTAKERLLIIPNIVVGGTLITSMATIVRYAIGAEYLLYARIAAVGAFLTLLLLVAGTAYTLNITGLEEIE